MAIAPELYHSPSARSAVPIIGPDETRPPIVQVAQRVLGGPILGGGEWFDSIPPGASLYRIFSSIPSHFSPADKVKQFIRAVQRLELANDDPSVAKCLLDLKWNSLPINIHIEFLDAYLKIKGNAPFDLSKQLDDLIKRTRGKSNIRAPFSDRFVEVISNLKVRTKEEMKKLLELSGCASEAHYTLKETLKAAEETIFSDGKTIQENLIHFIDSFFPGEQFEWIKPFVNSLLDRPHSHKEVIVSLGYFFAWAQIRKIDPRPLIDSAILDTIYALKAPSLYLPLVIEAVALWESLDREDHRKELFLRCGPRFRAANAPLLSLAASKDEFEEIHSSLFTGENGKLFKNAPHFKLLLKALIQIRSATELSLIEKQSFLRVVAHSKDKLKVLRNLAILFGLQAWEVLRTLPEGSVTYQEDYLSERGKECATRVAQVSTNNWEEKLERTFHSFRRPEAIWQYVANIAGIEQEDLRADAMKCLSLFINSVLDDSFHETRYDPSRNDHLARLSPDLVEIWRKPIECPNARKNIESPPQLLKRALGHKEYQNRLPSLFRYLSAATQEEREKALTHRPKAPPTKEASPEITKWYLFEQKCWALAVADEHDMAELSSRIAPLLTSLDLLECPEITAESKEKIGLWRRSIQENLTINLWSKDSDAPDDLLLMGTEIYTCQHVEAKGWNRGLLGTIMNGQNRLLLVVDQEGKMVGRSILRLLSDETGKPVLFLELYRGVPEHEDRVIQMAIKKAQAMRIPLVADPKALSDKQIYDEYQGPLYSHGGISPFDHSDAAWLQQQEPLQKTIKIPKSLLVRI